MSTSSVLEKTPEHASSHRVSTEPVFIFPQGCPVGEDLLAYLSTVVLPHMQKLAERLTPELVFEAAVLELIETYPEIVRESQYVRLRGRLFDGEPVENATPNQLRQHALAIHGLAADKRRRTSAQWFAAAEELLKTYTRSKKRPAAPDLYEHLRDALTSGHLRNSRPAPKLLESYRLADQGDETARDALVAYLQRPEVVAHLLPPCALGGAS